MLFNDFRMISLGDLSHMRRIAPGLVGLFVGLSLYGSAHAQANEGQVADWRLGDQSVRIESDNIEVRSDDNLAVFSGNVRLVQGHSLLQTDRVTVYYASDASAASPARIERIEAEGAVLITEDGHVSP